MLLPACCPECQHEYEIDSGYLGIKRICPACGAGFVFEVELTDDDGSTHTIADAQAFSGRVRIGCPQCFRITTVNELYADRDPVPCGVCGAAVGRDYGLQFCTVLTTAEDRARRLLLAGTRHRDIPPQLADCGLEAEAAADYFERHLVDLPFVRQQVAAGDNDRDDPLCYARDCDLCGCELGPGEREQAFEVRWRKTQGVADSDDDDFSWAGNEDAVPGVGVSERLGLYCICERCRRSLKAWFFNRFRGVPRCDGFRCIRVKPTPQRLSRPA